MMVTANLVGFAVGLDGVQYMLSQIFQLSGLTFILLTTIIIFSAVQLMFEVREEEARQGNRKPY